MQQEYEYQPTQQDMDAQFVHATVRDLQTAIGVIADNPELYQGMWQDFTTLASSLWAVGMALYKIEQLPRH